MYLKKSIYLILCVLAFACTKEYVAKPDQSGMFIKFFGGMDSEEAHAAEETTDGGFICVGTTRSFGMGSTDMYVVKTDANGNKIWEKYFGGGSRDEGRAVQVASDGGYIFLANYTQEMGDLDFKLIKTDQEGNVQWSKNFGMPGRNEKAYNVKITPDGGFLLIGNSETPDGIIDMYIVKTSADGSKEWEKLYGLTGLKDDVGSVQVTPNGNVIWCGTEYRDRTGNFPGSSDMRVISIQAQGSVLWDKNFGKGSTETGMDIQLTDDGFIVVGTTSDTKAGDTDVYVVRLFADGTERWNNKYGGTGNQEGVSIHPTYDGGYVITGSTEKEETGKDIYLLRVDSKGNELWSKTFGGRLSDTGTIVRQTADGGYMVSGTITFENNSMICLIKTNATGDVASR
jgi:hypothetical protein